MKLSKLSTSIKQNHMTQFDDDVASHRFRVASCHDVSDGAELSVNVFVDQSTPLAQRVQRAQNGHDLLRQRAAVSGCQRGLGAGLLPAHRTVCARKREVNDVMPNGNARFPMARFGKINNLDC